MVYNRIYIFNLKNRIGDLKKCIKPIASRLCRGLQTLKIKIMICKTNKELLAFATKIGNKFYDLHGLCYSDKSNDIFDEENDSLIDQRDCFYQYLVSELEHDIENDCVNLDYYNKELNANWDLCNQIEKYFQAVTQTKRPDYIYG